jgi:hypothetical protein
LRFLVEAAALWNSMGSLQLKSEEYTMTIISFNGKTYNSLEEMPADQRAAYEQVMSFMKDENNNGIPDMFEGDVVQKMMTMASTRVVVNGREVQSIETLPPEARAKFEKAIVKLSQLGLLPQEGAQGLPPQSPIQSAPQIAPSEPAFTPSPSSFAQSSQSAISEDTGSRTGLIIIAVLGVFLLCALLAAVGFLILNR